MTSTQVDDQSIEANLARNIRRIRENRRMTQLQLSERMGAEGRPVTMSGVSRLESGGRGCSPGELVALAVILECTVSELLLPEWRSTEEVALTPATRLPEADAWKWISGQLSIMGGYEVVQLNDLLTKTAERLADGAPPIGPIGKIHWREAPAKRKRNQGDSR